MAILLQIYKEFLNSFHSYSQCRYWINNAIIAIVLESIDIDVWSLSELGHIGQQEDFFLIVFKLFGDYLEFLGSVQSFREDHIGSGINVSL